MSHVLSVFLAAALVFISARAQATEALKASPKDATEIGDGPKRIGVMLDLFGEGSRLGGEQWINNTRLDQSTEFGHGAASVTGYVLFQQTERLRLGPAVRFFGNYRSNANRGFQFGMLTEALVLGEYSLPAFERFDAVFGGRAGVSILVPNSDFANEISRLQEQGAGVWSVPRAGWTVGANAGVRRPIAGNVFGRADFNVGLGHMYLFHTDEVVQELRFRKFWGIDQLRVGLTLGAEVAF